MDRLRRLDDLLPGPRRGQQDDHGKGDENPEEKRSPRVQATQERAQQVHFTGLKEVATASMKSLESTSSSVLSTQYTTPPLFQATMCSCLPL